MHRSQTPWNATLKEKVLDFPVGIDKFTLIHQQLLVSPILVLERGNTGLKMKNPLEVALKTKKTSEKNKGIGPTSLIAHYFKINSSLDGIWGELGRSDLKMLAQLDATLCRFDKGR